MEVISAKKIIELERECLTGKIMCFPTDTVYGVGVLYNDKEAIKKIYELKGRSYDKPLVNLCSNITQLEHLCILPSAAKELINRYWPGALTIILKSFDTTISFRMPDCFPLLKIINRFGLLATTSVNVSGRKELNEYDDINAVFGDKIDYFISDPWNVSRLPSTIVDISEGFIKVLRLGTIKI